MFVIENIGSLIENEVINEISNLIKKFEIMKFIMILLKNKFRHIQYRLDEFYIKIFDINMTIDQNGFLIGLWIYNTCIIIENLR